MCGAFPAKQGPKPGKNSLQKNRIVVVKDKQAVLYRFFKPNVRSVSKTLWGGRLHDKSELAKHVLPKILGRDARQLLSSELGGNEQSYVRRSSLP